jgi:hypothetical protein
MPLAGPAWRPAPGGGQHSAESGALQARQQARAGKMAHPSHRRASGAGFADPEGFGGVSRRVRELDCPLDPERGQVDADAWCATVDAHPGCDAPAVAEFRAPAGSGAPKWAARLQPGRRIPGAQRFPAFTCEPGDGSVDARFGAMAGFDVPGGPGAAASSGAGGTVAAGAAGSGSTAAAAGVTRAPAGKTAGWTRTPGFSLCCYHVNPRTYRTAERVWRPIAYFY